MTKYGIFSGNYVSTTPGAVHRAVTAEGQLLQWDRCIEMSYGTKFGLLPIVSKLKLTVFQRLGVTDYEGFRAKAEGGEVGRDDVLDVAALLANLKYATDHNQIPKPR